MTADVPDKTEAGLGACFSRQCDTGIGPTFLEALPDDIREEFLNQHSRDHQAAQHTEATHEYQTTQEFIDALPPEIRTGLQQEQDGIKRARRERERAAGATPSGVADNDPASFLASLELAP